MNIELIAIQVGEALKYKRSINEINRIANAVFKFSFRDFPNESISSTRSQLIYDWIMSTQYYPSSTEKRSQSLIAFVKSLTYDEPNVQTRLLNLLSNCELDSALVNESALARFDSRQFHSQIIKHCRKLYGQENYFHAIFEISKVYNRLVKSKAQSTEDGQSLMLSVWDSKNGVLKINNGTPETVRNVEDGIKFLSAGLMRAIRNPTGHEPALQWHVTEQDALDILSFVSYLLRQYDKAVYSA